MNDPLPPPPADDPDAPIADAGALFRDEPAAAPRPAPAPIHSPSGDASDGYDLDPVPEAEPTAPVPPPVPTRTPGTSAARARAPREAKPERDPDDAVSPVWTRGAEWGATLLTLAVGAVVVFGLVYVLLSLEEYGLAFLVLTLGGLVLAVLSYPIVVTLERPVRVTPEQAVKDFFGALSHHVPHYRRAWLLLSNVGRFEGPFATREGFQRYWKTRLAELRAGKASNVTPLKFQVEDFKSEKSAGRSELDVSYTVRVFVRGRQGEGPVASVRVQTTLVKGPDRMWYLDRGTLP